MLDKPQGGAADCKSVAVPHGWFDSNIQHLTTKQSTV